MLHIHCTFCAYVYAYMLHVGTASLCCTYRSGNCVPFKIRERGSPCDVLYTPGVDYVYVSYRRGGNLDDILYYIELVGLFISSLPFQCVELSRKVLCHYYLPPCGNSSMFEPPTSVCAEECSYVAETCPTEWAQLRTFIETYKDTGRRFGLTPLYCNNTAEYLHFESYSVCCSDVGIDIRTFTQRRICHSIVICEGV